MVLLVNYRLLYIKRLNKLELEKGNFVF